ncbi:MAG: carbohydrate ABC transporter permease [Anaerolineae bacterium]
MPSSWHPENYVDAWNTVPFTLFFRNSFLLAAINILGVTLSSSLAAYGFARLKFWGRDAAFAVLLATMMLPGWVTLIPQFIVFRLLGWINTWLPLTVPAFLGGASSIFLMRQFFLTLPLELDEAAELDGCSKFGIYWRILLPLCKPVLATISIFTFLSVWDSFLIPLIYLHRQELFTVAIGLAFMRSAIVEGPTQARMPVQALVMAAGVFTSLPGIIVFFLGQRYFVQGIALTGRTGI